jgi:hypothetical protein
MCSQLPHILHLNGNFHSITKVRYNVNFSLWNWIALDKLLHSL